MLGNITTSVLLVVNVRHNGQKYKNVEWFMFSPVAYRSPLRWNHWKHVDDIIIAEVVLHGSSSNIQSDLDDISKWAQENSMNPNPKKCKEMLISFLQIDPEVHLLEQQQPT